jgi:ribose transport system substrate-binding protein
MRVHRHAVATLLAVSAAALLVTLLRVPRYAGPDAQALRFIRSLPLLGADTLDGVQPLQGRGPHGETPATVNQLVEMLSLDDIRTVRQRGATAAICMQDVDNDWSRLQVVGIRQVLERCGVEILAVTDGEFDVDKQLADYGNVLEMRPDIIITLPLDADRSAPVLRAGVQAGIRLVFVDDVPSSLVHPIDYVGVVVADSYANGRVAAEAMVNRLGGKGCVAMLHWSNSMFTCDERSRAARATFAGYPGIHVVAERYFDGNYDVQRVTRTS